MRCDGCGAVNIVEFTAVGADHSGHAHALRNALDDPSDAGISEMEWFPKDAIVRKVVDVPMGIDEAAGEAIAALTIGAYKASVLMCRAVIEATAKNHGITGGTLAGKINALQEQRIITPATGEAAHEVRLLANDMAHGDFATATVTDAEAAEIVEITEGILEEVYQRPARTARARERRLAAH